jgi:hypothetical protein
VPGSLYAPSAGRMDLPIASRRRQSRPWLTPGQAPLLSLPGLAYFADGLSSALRLSTDGLFYWDGQRWVSAISPDGRYRWDGTGWVPLQQAFHAPAYAPRPAYAPVPAAPAPPARVRLPTSWTRPLQYAVGGYYLLSAAWWVVLPFVLEGSVAGYVNRFVQEQEAIHPDQPLPPPDFASSMTNILSVSLIFGAVIAVAVAGIVIVGALKRWTWLFYAVLVLLGLSVLSLPYGLASATGLVQPVSATFSIPAQVQWMAVGFGVIATALCAWMLVALLRRGPWATRQALRG